MADAYDVYATSDTYQLTESSTEKSISLLGQDLCVGGTENTAAADGHKAVLFIDGSRLPVTLRNEPSANDLYSRLPVTLSFKDFSGMEKIAYFDKRLDETGQKVGCHPLAGDLCVYQPWAI